MSRLGRFLVAALVSLAVAAGPALAFGSSCQDQTNCCCCGTEGVVRDCVMACADDYAGVARLEASPLRVTSSLQKPVASASGLVVTRNFRIIPLRQIRARGGPRVASPPKRYLTACTLRL